MSVLTHFLAKELTEIRRTWRLPTIGGVLLFFAVMSPLAALATPALMDAAMSGTPGLKIEIPDPTYLDSYAQWVKNLSQIGLLLVVFASAGLIASERTSGTAVLVVTKPVSRAAFAIAKFLAQAALVTVATLLGTVVTWLGTRLAFGAAPPAELFASTGAWLAGALLAIALTEALSAVLPTLSAGIVGLVVAGLASAAALIRPLALYTPIGLMGAPGSILAGKPVLLAMPLLTTAVAIAALVALAGWLFGMREL